VEGRDLPVGACDRGPIDVVVCDGFVGNVLLKFYEALAPTLMGVFAKALGAERDALEAAFRELDYSEHGGAPLLGVRGVSIISHGQELARARSRTRSASRARRRVAHERAHRAPPRRAAPARVGRVKRPSPTSPAPGAACPPA
jgi:glycerol-3-phosphate acyltransferase PlsX